MTIVNQDVISNALKMIDGRRFLAELEISKILSELARDLNVEVTGVQIRPIKKQGQTQVYIEVQIAGLLVNRVEPIMAEKPGGDA